MFRTNVLVAILLLALTTTASAAPYVTSLGGSAADGFAINDSGAIAGMFLPIPNAVGGFLYDNGVHELFGADTVTATAINASNQVVGQTAAQKAYLYSNGQRLDLDSPDWYSLEPLGINDEGRIVGAGGAVSNGYTHAFSYFQGIWTDLGFPDGHNSFGYEVLAYDVNNAGVAVGSYDSWLVGSPESSGGYATRGFVYQNGVATDIGTLGGSATIPRAINDSGQIVGWSLTVDNKLHAFLYTDGAMHDLGAFSNESYAYGINDLGQVVGVSDGKAFLYSDGVMVDLNTLIDAPEWRLDTAYGINNLGQIVGSGAVMGGMAAFILTPVPEPSSYTLASFAIACLGILYIWRRQMIIKQCLSLC